MRMSGSEIDHLESMLRELDAIPPATHKNGSLSNNDPRIGPYRAGSEGPRKSVREANVPLITRTSALTLCRLTFEPVRFIIPEFIPEGVTLLAGRPKLGKSWMMLQIGASVALGHSVLNGASEPPTHGDVLYLALEDNERRMQRRLIKHYGYNENAWPDRLQLCYACPRIDEGGFEALEQWCKEVERPTLIMIDTLVKIRPNAKQPKKEYDSDYQACELLIKLAHKYPGLCILVSHHDRKAEADDVFDTVSGTLGLTGGVDAIAMLKRKNGGITLHIQGRELADSIEKAVELDRDTCRWSVLGDANEVHKSASRNAILLTLKGASYEGMSVAEITQMSGLPNKNAVHQMLFRMVKDKEIKRVKAGHYVLCEPPDKIDFDL